MKDNNYKTTPEERVAIMIEEIRKWRDPNTVLTDQEAAMIARCATEDGEYYLAPAWIEEWRER